MFASDRTICSLAGFVRLFAMMAIDVQWTHALPECASMFTTLQFLVALAKDSIAHRMDASLLFAASARALGSPVRSASHCPDEIVMISIIALTMSARSIPSTFPSPTARTCSTQRCARLLLVVLRLDRLLVSSLALSLLLPSLRCWLLGHARTPTLLQARLAPQPRRSPQPRRFTLSPSMLE